MHSWGDDWFEKYGDDLYEASQYISKNTKRWSLCYPLHKEKYGTIRWEHIIPPKGHVACLRFPIQSPWKVSFTDTQGRKHSYRPILFAWNDCWLYRKWQEFGAWVLGKFIQKAIKKWPHLEAELCQDYHFDTKFGRICRNKYWRSL